MPRPKTSKKELIQKRNETIKDMLTRGISQSDIASILYIPRNTVHLVAMENIANEEEVAICIEWLNLQQKMDNVNRRYNSYNLKHIIEKWGDTYISNDSLVEAVKRLDMDYELCGDSGRFIYLPISSKTVKLYTLHLKGKNLVAPLKR